MKPMCKAELRQFIDQVSFMIDDITLFLDTHPDCREAIDAYNHFKMMRCEAVSDYVKQYGPLNRYDVDTCDDWNAWIDGPWPWEGACGCQMWIYEKRLQCPVNIKETNAKLAQAIISQYGGPDGEMGASMRYLSQRYAMPYKECQATLTDIGTEELGHLEIVASIIYQLTKNLSMEEIKASGFDKYYIDHTIGIWPQAAGGIPFNACEFQSKGDTITDLYEDLAAEQKARSTYDNILRLCKDYPDVYEPIKFLRAREVVHFQRFGEALRLVQDKLDEKNFYAFNPAFDRSAPCVDKKKCNCEK